MVSALNKVAILHSNRITLYKRLLSSNDLASAEALHRVHSEIALLTAKSNEAEVEIQRLKNQLEHLKKNQAPESPPLTVSNLALQLFNEMEIRQWIKNLTSEKRFVLYVLAHLKSENCI